MIQIKPNITENYAKKMTTNKNKKNNKMKINVLNMKKETN